MKFVIAVFSPPYAPSARRALRFTEAALVAGHEITRVFFYQDGVHNASANIVAPQDELDTAAAWQALIQANGLDGVVCVVAALRRGTLDADEARRWERPGAIVLPPLELSGLGQLHEAVQEADRLMCFGGD